METLARRLRAHARVPVLACAVAAVAAFAVVASTAAAATSGSALATVQPAGAAPVDVRDLLPQVADPVRGPGAARALVQLGHDAVPALTRIVARHPRGDELTTRRAVQALGRLRGDAIGAIDALVALLPNCRGALERDVLRALGDIGSRAPRGVALRVACELELAGPLAGATAQEWDIARRRLELGPRPTPPQLAAWLCGADPGRITAAASAVADADWAPEPAVWLALARQCRRLRASHDADRAVGEIARAAMRHAPHGCHRFDALGLLVHHVDADMRLRAVEALAATADERAVPSLCDAACDEGQDVRLAAIAALGELGAVSARARDVLDGLAIASDRAAPARALRR